MINPMTQRIRSAIKENRVVIELQPIYSVKEARFMSAEVLVRLMEDGKMIYPGEFIDYAEENGLIQDLDMKCFEESCKFIASHDMKRLGLQYLEVNMSVKSGEMISTADRYINIARQYQVNPEQINLEVTENSQIRNKKAILTNMNKLIQQGFSFSLDDFGNGERSLNSVLDLPTSILKFDSTITSVCGISNHIYGIIITLIKMIHALGLKIVAEGIEDEILLERMVDAGVDYIQGYYYSKPLREHDFVQFLMSNKFGAR